MKVGIAIWCSISALLISGCANTNSIYRKGAVYPTGQTEIVDAKQRAIIAVPYYEESRGSRGNRANGQQKGTSRIARLFPAPFFSSAPQPSGFRVCAEAAPDVFSIYALAASAQAGGQTNAAGDVSGDAALALSFSENGATIERTQTINLIRESMYRTCERYLSGAIDKTTMQIQAARDQRAMVAILAIEQLTGVVKRQPTVLTTEAKSSLVTANLELMNREMKESDEVEQKLAAYNAAVVNQGSKKSDFEKLNEGKCEAILQAPAPDAPALSGGPDAVETKTVTETKKAADGSSEVIETQTPTVPEPSDQQKQSEADAANLANQKSDCQGAKNALSEADAKVVTAESELKGAKEKLKTTHELIAKLATTVLSAEVMGQGTGDDGSEQSAVQVVAVASKVESIARLAFESSAEMVYVCTTLVPTLLNYRKTADHQDEFISDCFSLLSGSVSKEVDRMEKAAKPKKGTFDYVWGKPPSKQNDDVWDAPQSDQGGERSGNR